MKSTVVGPRLGLVSPRNVVINIVESFNQTIIACFAFNPRSCELFVHINAWKSSICWHGCFQKHLNPAWIWAARANESGLQNERQSDTSESLHSCTCRTNMEAYSVSESQPTRSGCLQSVDPSATADEKGPKAKGHLLWWCPMSVKALLHCSFLPFCCLLKIKKPYMIYFF